MAKKVKRFVGLNQDTPYILIEEFFDGIGETKASLSWTRDRLKGPSNILIEITMNETWKGFLGERCYHAEPTPEQLAQAPINDVDKLLSWMLSFKLEAGIFHPSQESIMKGFPEELVPASIVGGNGPKPVLKHRRSLFRNPRDKIVAISILNLKKRRKA